MRYRLRPRGHLPTQHLRQDRADSTYYPYFLQLHSVSDYSSYFAYPGMYLRRRLWRRILLRHGMLYEVFYSSHPPHHHLLFDDTDIHSTPHRRSFVIHYQADDGANHRNTDYKDDYFTDVHCQRSCQEWSAMESWDCWGCSCLVG